MQVLKIEQFEHKNQFIITTPNAYFLQSYNSTVARVTRGEQSGLALGSDWDYSNTTLRHVYEFIKRFSSICLPEKNKGAFIRAEIANGEIATF